MKDNIVLNKSEDFGIRILKLYEILKQKKAPHPVILQITKSGTSIGANLFEATCGISDNDFLAKAYIALKETSETKYWLKLLYKTNYISDEQFESLYKDCDEIFRILSAITKTLKNKINNKNK